MTKEERADYMRKWREENRDRIKIQQRESARRKAMADLASVKQLDTDICVVRSNDGRAYVVTGRKR